MCPAGDRDLPAVAVVLDRVGEQVHQDLVQPLPVGQDRQFRVRALMAEGDRALGGERRHELAGLLDHERHEDRFHRQAELARLDPGDVDQLVDQREQVPPGGENALHAVPVLGAEIGQLQ